jgi:hypothetical protein
MRLIMTIAIVGMLGAAATLDAHEDFRVIGTISKHAGSTLAVKSRDGKTASIRIDKQTAISKDKKKVDAAALTVGLSVVVDAYGDSEDDLLALDIRIVPPIGRAPAK